ncbi:cyclic pyranopterin monophosphate synthase, mitochondrial-like [Macadamia integrifolia]|uniref:cyclic pyranopterin monophosphate synthase, mitochondrial-like n=1 Tax=Macadamia integrifolia TaxID=60698 RepID=UPI001C52802F|nr:cyclic pyranopterin monophosphate synthase, mitochondrial-like [Macadamia integrifolia]XP_042479556.1 cyclic pyranopterin monophosphate synthase, mitochondrial-like [Macadamia integrifolia]XP_042479558.1 cyclic pyranopterin monophosphate synthase, mitochondrial-like [Macadamia integrifolia]XP_042479559.1 cyclic pyranopterin monophosphate synthase, mitochondrial-like [Macadamia integrifolia]XP_042479560.1 cyclic pyranopterin monophosphate synthase, mitochondrial-like [Macadamia integrifolia]
MFLRRVRATFPSSIRCFSSNGGHDLTAAIAEPSKEMESVFGQTPPIDLSGSVNNLSAAPEPQLASTGTEENEQRLTHISRTGEAQMVDVSSKGISKRVAIAGCKVLLVSKKVFDLVSENQVAKGDVLSVAKIAGISGAKQTSNLIPLCHNISLTHVRVDLTLNEKDFSVEIEGEAASTGKTGVETEALTAVTIAGLTLYDMCKAASKDIEITDVRLLHKSGSWSRKQ